MTKYPWASAGVIFAALALASWFDFGGIGLPENGLGSGGSRFTVLTYFLVVCTLVCACFAYLRRRGGRPPA